MQRERQQTEKFNVILNKQRRKWFATEMSNSRQAFTQDKDLVLFTGTWNVNGRSPDATVDLSPWLFPQSLRNRPVDLYMIGLQEVQTLSGVDAVRTDNTKGHEWNKKIQHTLSSDFELIATRQLVGIMVFAFIRKNHTPYISNVQLSYAATGFLNAGNKGGVAARFKLYNRTICCVACHLAAHTANVERRNQDFSDVARKASFMPEHDAELKIENYELQTLKHYSKSTIDTTFNSFTLPSNPIMQGSASGSSSWLGLASAAANAFYDISAGANSSVLNNPNAITVLDHDIIFWLGDLNYRIDASADKVLEYIRMCDWDNLYTYDQLQKQMQICEAFVGFKEGPIQFAPTYKFERFENEYAKDENGGFKRIPAYTDRILWRFGVDEDDPNGMPDLSLDEYSSAQSVFSSDHRPVYALFRMTFGVEDFTRKRKVEDEINKELDVRQANYKPSLQISSPFVDLGDVYFEQEYERTVSIRNVGTVPTIFSAKTPSDFPRWVVFDRVHWQDIELAPGRSVSLDIRIVVSSKNGTADVLCSEGCKMEATILLSANPGNVNELIQIRGRYMATTLGLSLETLSLLSEPVTNLTKSPPSRTREILYRREFDDDQKSAPGIVPLSVPKELWILIDALVCEHDGDKWSHLNKFPSLFLGKVNKAEVQQVVKLIDNAERIPREVSGDAIAACLLLVLEKMDGSVVPHFAYKRVVEAGYTEDENMARAVTDLFPPINRNVFWYIVGLLCQIPSVKRGENRGKAIAEAVGRELIRGFDDSSTRDERSKSLFMQAAIRYQQRKSANDYTAIIDLTNPQTHPRKLTRNNV